MLRLCRLLGRLQQGAGGCSGLWGLPEQALQCPGLRGLVAGALCCQAEDALAQRQLTRQLSLRRRAAPITSESCRSLASGGVHEQMCRARRKPHVLVGI